MHILQSYSANARARIARPILIPQYYPITYENYITIQGDAKYNARKYSYWNLVMELIKPILQDNNIKIVQIGAKDDNVVQGADLNLCGKANFRQTYDIIKNAKLHVGVDSFSIHVASVFNTKIVGIYSNTLPSNSGPYFSDPKDVILIQSPRGDRKPTYVQEEHPKTIDLIKPEEIAKSIVKLLGIEDTIVRKTVAIGERAKTAFLEYIPDCLVSNNLYPEFPLHIRYDYVEGSDQALQYILQQISIRKCVLVTDKFVEAEKLKSVRGNLAQIIVMVKGADQLSVVRELCKLGISIALMTELNDEELLKLKLSYSEFGVIHQVTKFNKGEIELSEETIFVSSKILLSKNNVYVSRAHWIKNIHAENNMIKADKIGSFIELDEFWEDVPFMYVYNE